MGNDNEMEYSMITDEERKKPAVTLPMDADGVPLLQERRRRKTICSNCRHSMSATGRSCRENMQTELIERAKRLAGTEEQDGGERTAIADKEER